jgi:hypothetical protein
MLLALSKCGRGSGHIAALIIYAIQAAVVEQFFFFLLFCIIILYCNRIYYMYRALREVVRGEEGGNKGTRQSLATLRSLGRQSRPGEDRSQRLVLHRPVKVKLRQGVSLPPWCTAAGSEQRLVPPCTGSLPR